MKDGILLAATWFAVSGFTLFMGWRSVQRSRSSSKWPCVQGVIVQSDIVKQYEWLGFVRTPGASGKYLPVVRYRYTVDGVEHDGKRVSFALNSYTQTRWGAARVTSRYPLGQPAMVFHNPLDADDAALDTGIRLSSVLVLLLGAAFALAGVPLVLQVIARAG